MNKIIILAAGKGTRMKSDLPKTLFPINGKPMIKYLLDSVFSSQIDDSPIVVVSPGNREIIQESIDEYPVNFAIQPEPLGTGHAVLSAKDLIPDEASNVLILYGDQPFISQKSIVKILENHDSEVSMMTVKLSDFDEWRKNFFHWGRIIRENNQIREIVEFKDADDNIKEIKEVNPAVFCFNKEWLLKNIENLKNNNNQKEYYLTDLIKMAFEQNIKIKPLFIDAREAIGVNSPEELDIARSLID
ncbi:MAG TPA: NTP transferase domain-containing protein [bacterium]|nr:NTP transferase domain-containing protein [bacterium]